MKKIFVCLCIFLFISRLSLAQEQYGNVRGVVVDDQGIPLPGVTVTLDSELYSDRAVVTSDAGIFRFLNLAPGVCLVKCELSGFRTYVQENIIVRVGGNVELKITMEPAVLEEEVTVVAESPVIDMKKTGTAVNVTQEMLQEIPSARDPWVILKQVPGILTRQENVGGSESGQQALFTAKGAWFKYTMWNMDGVTITDMDAKGGAPMYYDFDSFEEMQVVTSGQDASIQTGGVSINLITRRGGNKFQVVARAFFTNDSLQGDNRTQELIDLDYVGNQINQILDYGVQVGGPIKKDRAWFWLGYGVQDIKHYTIDGYPQDTKLQGINVKLNLRLSRHNRAELTIIRNTKVMYGRGAGPTSPPETTWDQAGSGKPFIKFEDEHMFSNNFLLSLKLSAFPADFWADPKGGIDVQEGFDLSTGMWSGSASYNKIERPQYGAKIDGNYFVEDLLGGSHEFKFGIEYRLTNSRTKQIWAGDTRKYYWNGAPLYARVYRGGRWDYGSDRYSIYLNDAYSRGRLALNFGFRLDREKSVNHETDVAASRIAPDLLPALTIPEIDPGIVRWTFSPRLGFTYDLTGDGKFIIRGNLARYGVHSGAGFAAYISPAANSWATYRWKDINGDDTVTIDELVGYPTSGILSFRGFDPWNPTALESPNGIDKDFRSPLTDELILGVEKELFADFSLGANFTLRRNHRFRWTSWGDDALYDKETGKVFTQDDYVGPITGTIEYEGKTYNYEYWTLNQYRPAGTYRKIRPGNYENYSGFEVIATKRLSHRWMMSASFNYEKFNFHYGERGYEDPTNVEAFDGAGAHWGGGPEWMAKLSFLYQLPWGFNISCFANARQGFINLQRIVVPSPERGAVGLGGTTTIYIEKPGETRLPNFYNVDASLTKEFHLGDYGRLSLQVDAFNMFNYAHDLSRFPQANSPRHNEIQRILNPRVIRFGIRYRF